MMMVDKDVQELVSSLDCSDEEILRKFRFTNQGMNLSDSQAINFIRFLRSEIRDNKTVH